MIHINRNETSACDICANKSYKRLFAVSDFDSGTQNFWLECCEKCHVVRTAPVPRDEELAGYYNSNYYGGGEKKFDGVMENWTSFTQKRLAKKIFNACNSNGTKTPPLILDIGCGRGYLLKWLALKGCICHGIERREFPSITGYGSITIHRKPIQQIEFKENSFDAIVLWHVLEHLNNPTETINIASRILKRNGTLFIAVPNFGSLQAKLFRKHWFHLDIPRHFTHYTPQTISKLVDLLNFKVVNKSTFTLDQSLFGFIQSFINMTGLFPPNNFYISLHASNKRTNHLRIFFNVILGVILLPLAVLEYVLSGAIQYGSCVVIEAKNNK